MRNNPCIIPGVSLLLNYQLIRKLTTEAGPEFGFLVHSGLSLIKYEKKVDFGIDAGVRYNLTPAFDNGLRYNLGLTNVASFEFTSGSGTSNGLTNLTNQALPLSLSYNLWRR